MAQTSPAPASNPLHALDGGGLILGPANISVVRTAAQLKQAIVSRARDIEVREHLDLTPLLYDRGPFIDTVSEEFYRTALIDPLALLLVEVETRSIRGNCSNPDAAAALELPMPKPGPGKAALLPLKPFQCMLLLPDTFLAVEKGHIWVDNLYLRFKPRPQQVLHDLRRTPSFITVGRLLQNSVAYDYTPTSHVETPPNTNLHLTDITFQGDEDQAARGIYLSGYAAETTVYVTDCVFTDWNGHASPLLISRLGSASITGSVFRNMEQSAEIVDVSYGGLVRFENVLFADAVLPDMHVVGTSMNDYRPPLHAGYDEHGVYYSTDDESYDVKTTVLPPNKVGVFDADRIIEIAVMSDCLFLEYEENDTTPQPGCPPESIQARQAVAARMSNPNATIKVNNAVYYEEDYQGKRSAPEDTEDTSYAVPPLLYGNMIDSYGSYADLDYSFEYEPYRYIESPFAAERLTIISEPNRWFTALRQVLPQRPAAPPQWPPFEVAPTLPQNVTPRYPNLQLAMPSLSSTSDGDSSTFQSSTVVIACTVPVAAALLLVAAYMWWRFSVAKGSPAEAAQVPDEHMLKPPSPKGSCQPQSAMNSAYEYSLPSHLALYYKTLEMTASTYSSNSQHHLRKEDLPCLVNAVASSKHTMTEDVNSLPVLPVPPPLGSWVKPAVGHLSTHAGKTAQAPHTTLDAYAGSSSGRCDQQHVHEGSTTAVKLQEGHPCSLTTGSSAGSTDIIAPYSASITGASPRITQTGQSRCECRPEESNSVNGAEQSSRQLGRCTFSKTFHLAQTGPPFWSNDDGQSRISKDKQYLGGGIEQYSSELLVAGPCARLDKLELTCEDRSVCIQGEAKRIGDLHTVSTGKEEAFTRLQRQLDLFDKNSVLLGRFATLGRYHRRRGGQAVIQFVECKDDHGQYAIKFFLDRESFLTEAALYAACLPTMPAVLSESASKHLQSILPRTASGGGLHFPEAVARCLPQLEAVVDCEAASGPLNDPRGRPLPSCIVLEKGDPLDDWTGRSDPDIFTTLAILSSVCQRLKDLHAAGYVHRDLKPSNVMWLPRQNRWTLIDFGCIARIGAKAPLNFTFTYAAPEVIAAFAAGALDVEASSALDAWSLGVMAFELLTGAPAFQLLTDGALMVVSMLKGDLPLPWEKDLSKQQEQQLGPFKDPVLHLLQRDPAKRSDMLTFHAACIKIFSRSEIAKTK